MNEDIEITQKAAVGSQTTQIAVQNNMGLTISDATTMAFAIFREYYPQFKENALSELHEMVKRELEKLQPDEVIPPKPKIALPVLQNASITDEDDIRRIYAKLLAGSMDASKAVEVHPAFVSVVNQLNYYDAKVLKQIAKINNTIPAARVTINFGTRYLSEILPWYFTPYLYDNLDVWKVSLSLDNLSRLNIITVNEGNMTGYDYKKITSHPFIQGKFQEAVIKNPTRSLEIKQIDLYIQVTDFGNKFMELCVPN